MRFFRDGPSIPDKLLTARDEGRVVFYCGSGVSRACAKLPDFFELAQQVVKALGVPKNHSACLILQQVQNINELTGVSGLISMDHVFGLLERDFTSQDIESAVAQSLKPKNNADLTAHQILLDLATTPQGRVNLVTTNFDRLFEDCRKALKTFQPPHIPNPARHDQMDGIVHLHGIVDEAYRTAVGDRLILSRSDFGDAYLSAGWATEFVRTILDRFVVVFVGYMADDPPVQYLLEALNRKSSRFREAYAFQSGKSSATSANWQHKGVIAIPYADSNDHVALWNTLAAWAKRARNPAAWFDSTMALAQKDPSQLNPHERGQVVHMVKTLEGARKFASDDPPPPPEWLCVLDQQRRYAAPVCSGESAKNKPVIDPFDLFGLDSDIAPARPKSVDQFEKREIPVGTWDGLAAMPLDRVNLKDESHAVVRGPWSVQVPSLPPRLAAIGRWIANVADQSTAVWWAAHQFGLHPDIQKQILWRLERQDKVGNSVILQAWNYLFEYWDYRKDLRDSDWYQLESVINKHGWDHVTIRRFATISRPYLKADASWVTSSLPPDAQSDTTLRDLMTLDVDYRKLSDVPAFPDDLLPYAVCELRKNLEHAQVLESELGGYGLIDISPIIPDDKQQGNTYGRKRGLSGMVISFSSLFERLTTIDITAAKHEFDTWPSSDDTIFSRLRIWACHSSNLVSTKSFGRIIASLSDNAFWCRRHQRDLLLVLAKRWGDLPVSTRKAIEDRILQGRVRWKYEDNDVYEDHKAWESLNRFHWLETNDCELVLDLKSETTRLRKIAREWKPEYAVSAADSMEGCAGWVRTITDDSLLEL